MVVIPMFLALRNHLGFPSRADRQNTRFVTKLELFLSQETVVPYAFKTD